MLYPGTMVVREQVSLRLAGFAVRSLLEEVRLTPKPGLVDGNGNGSHHDLNIGLMETSAMCLSNTFFEMAMASYGMKPGKPLREKLAAIGRRGEQVMLARTGQVNTHKGAIWVLGLLTGATSVILGRHGNLTEGVTQILTTAGAIARHEDGYQTATVTHGDRVRQQYRVRSAREEAAACFPSLQYTALPAWAAFRHEPDNIQKLNVLLALISVVDDTCILHRSDMEVLRCVQQLAGAVISSGGMSTPGGRHQYSKLDRYVAHHWVSPGGSADLLAAAIFLEKIIHQFKTD